jgi:hypothetical protein
MWEIILKNSNWVYGGNVPQPADKFNTMKMTTKKKPIAR